MSRLNFKCCLRTLCVTALSALLVACGGGSARTDIGGATTVFEIGNTTTTRFERMTIQPDGAGVTYNAPLGCDPGQTDCLVAYRGADLTTAATLRFYGPSDQLVAAYRMPEAPGDFFRAYPNRFTTGAHLFEAVYQRLQSSVPLTLDDMGLRLDHFFTDYDSADGLLDNNEELGDLFAAQQSRANALDESAFIEQLASRLLGNEVAAPQELVVASSLPSQLFSVLTQWLGLPTQRSTFSLMSTAHAASAQNCSPEMYKFSKTLNLASHFFGPGEAFVYLASGVLKDHCDPTANKFEKIQSALGTLQDSISRSERALNQLATFTYETAIRNHNARFNTLRGRINEQWSDYNLLLLGSGHSSLMAHVQAQGGLQKALSASPALRRVLGYPMMHSDGQPGLIPSIRSLTSQDLDTVVAALNNLCRSPGVGQDVIMVRRACNLQVVRTMSQLLALQDMAIPMLADIYAVLHSDPAAAIQIAVPPSGAPSFGLAFQYVTTEFMQQATSAAVSLEQLRSAGGTETGFFELLAGINTALRQGLLQASCFFSSETTDSNNVKSETRTAAIGNWVKAGAAANDYLVTYCRDGGPRGAHVKARWYLNSQSDFGGTIMGVPVPRAHVAMNQDDFQAGRFPSGWGTSNLAVHLQQNSVEIRPPRFKFTPPGGRVEGCGSLASNRSRWDARTSSTPTAIGSDNLSGENPNRQFGRLYNGTAALSRDPSSGTLACGEAATGQSRWVTPMTVHLENPDWSGSSGFQQRHFNYIRVQAEGGVHYLFGFEIGYHISGQLNTGNKTRYASHHCLSHDCYTPSGLTEGQSVSFRNGPYQLSMFNRVETVNGSQANVMGWTACSKAPSSHRDGNWKGTTDCPSDPALPTQ